MTDRFSNVEEALAVLADPLHPDWEEGFALMTDHPDTTSLLREHFLEKFARMNIEPTGTNPATGEPSYSVEDMARALGVPAELLDVASRRGGSSGEE